jgi:hypothetical protein
VGLIRREVGFEDLPEDARRRVLEVYRGCGACRGNLPGVTRRAVRGIKGYE